MTTPFTLDSKIPIRAQGGRPGRRKDIRATPTTRSNAANSAKHHHGISQNHRQPMTTPFTLDSKIPIRAPGRQWRSEEHTSELQSLMRISYAVVCLKTKNVTHKIYETRRRVSRITKYR